MKNENDTNTERERIANDALFGLGVAEVETALATFRRCHDLLYGKMTSNLVESMKEPLPDDGKETGEAWLDGYKQGRETGIGCFPAKIEGIPIGAILAAIHAPNAESIHPESKL